MANVIFYEPVHGKFDYAFWREKIIIYDRDGKVFLRKLRLRNNRRLLAAAFQPVERESCSHGKS